MKARDIIQQLCREGDNVWQTGMLGLWASTIKKLLETWTPKRKQSIVRKNAERHQELVDHVVLDDYDLTLWYTPVSIDFEPSGHLFAVAINSEQHDPTDELPQRLKFPGSSLRHLPITSIAGVLRRWINDYGKLAIGTVELRKLEIYKKLLQKHGFKITDMRDTPNAGFFIEL